MLKKGCFWFFVLSVEISLVYAKKDGFFRKFLGKNKKKGLDMFRRVY